MHIIAHPVLHRNRTKISAISVAKYIHIAGEARLFVYFGFGPLGKASVGRSRSNQLFEGIQIGRAHV